MAVAQADLMVKNPLWRAQRRLNNEAVFRQADAQVAAEARDAAANSPPETQKPVADSGQVAQTPGDAFSPDLGRKLYVEFVGSPKETQRLRELLAWRGHTIVAGKEEAEVAYLIEGEYVVPETRQ